MPNFSQRISRLIVIKSAGQPGFTSVTRLHCVQDDADVLPETLQHVSARGKTDNAEPKSDERSCGFCQLEDRKSSEFAYSVDLIDELIA